MAHGHRHSNLIGVVLLAISIMLLPNAKPLMAQPAEISVRAEGTIQNDCFNNLDGLAFRWRPLQLIISAKSQVTQTGATIGFVIYSPDNSTSSDTILSAQMSPDWASATYWNLGGGLITEFFGNGLPDSLLTGGAMVTNAGFQSNNFVDILTLDINLTENGIICIDSSFILPSGSWFMSPGGAPLWHGGAGDVAVGGTSSTAFCLTITDPSPGPNSCFLFSFGISTSSQVRLGNTLVVSDTLNIVYPDLADFSVTNDGAGIATIDSAGYSTYTPSPLDVDKTIEFGISFTMEDNLSPCPEINRFLCEGHGSMISVLPQDNCCDVPGDADHSGSTNIGDVTYMIQRIFNGGPPPICPNESDPNADGFFNIGDVTMLITRIFANGVAPVCGTIVN